MSEILKAFHRKLVVPIGTVNGATAFDSDEESSSSESEDYSDKTHYEQDFVTEEMGKYAQFSTEGSKRKHKKGTSHLCEVDGVGSSEYKVDAFNIYSQYDFSKSFIRKELPIDSCKNKILELLNVNNVIIIQGPTGCGKTTQVPQYILDDCKNKNIYCNIAVTQPRKIAAINVARRVCEEREWTLGTVCGYQVGLEKKVSSNILLTYMTTGVLLQKLIVDKNLNQFTHIVIDEIHERNQELDFLLLIVRKFLFTNSPMTKVVLMSATIDAEEFAHYFRCQSFQTALPAPIIYVNKKSSFVKTVFYMEHLYKGIKLCEFPQFDIDKPEINESLWTLFTFLVCIIDKLDVQDPTTGKTIIGSVLVFLPGIHEIEEAKRRLEAHYNEVRIKPEVVINKEGAREEIQKIKWEIIPLHSSLPNDEQIKAFLPVSPGHRKIILSTNIAESSITVPDSYYVIDFCQTKVMTVDPITKFMSLKLEWASHINCEQRAGRVGRTANGRVYRLVPREFYTKNLPKKSIPEILNAPLERVILQAKALELKDTPAQILALALNPPNLKNVETTILALKEMGALLQTCRGIRSNVDGDITFLGTVMAKLPIDVKLSKLIVLGQLFGCLNETIIIAAGCSIQNIFSIPFQQRFNAYKKLLMWADGSCSDLIALLNLYQVWQTYQRENQLDKVSQERTWCQVNLISFKGLREWNLLVNEIKLRLNMLNIRETSGPGKIILTDVEKPFVLKVITAGAFYPNYFISTSADDKEKERNAVKTVAGRDPFRTVYFSGMDPYQPGPLYIKAIKEMLGNKEGRGQDLFVGFDGSCKIYIEFQSHDRRTEYISTPMDCSQRLTSLVSGKIPYEVYEVIRKRQLNYLYKLKLYPLDVAQELAETYGIKKNSTFQSITTNEEENCFTMTFNPIPSLDTEFITLKLTEFIDASHFWATSLESECYLVNIEQILNKQILHRVTAALDPNNKNLVLGKIYAARFHEDNQFYRCKILSYTANSAQIIFIDYGNMQKIDIRELYFLPDLPECNLLPLCIECVLHGIQPSLKENPKGVWSDWINEIVRRQITGVLLHARVHSVVENVVYLELYKTQIGNEQVKSINQILIEHNYAEPAVESFLSKMDHEKREMVRKADNRDLHVSRISYEKIVNTQEFEIPKRFKHEKEITLKGPYSPLEMKYQGCIESALNKSVEVDGSSVNSVLLDNEPQNYQTSLLVACYVGQTANGSRLRLRQTTLLPAIAGLPMVLTLMFCPTMRVKLTDDGTKVASILCGLGCNKFTHKSCFPAHDLSLTLDTKLTEAEINKINQMRFYMNQGIKSMKDISEQAASEEEMITTQNTLKKELKELTYMRREIIERVNVKFANVWGKNTVDAVILKPSLNNEDDDVWPLLGFVKLKEMEGYSPSVGKNLDDLDQVARNMIPVPEDFKCELCLSSPLATVYEVRYHLMSEDHKKAYKKYQENLDNSYEFDDDDDDNDVQ